MTLDVHHGAPWRTMALSLFRNLQEFNMACAGMSNFWESHLHTYIYVPIFDIYIYVIYIYIYQM